MDIAGYLSDQIRITKVKDHSAAGTSPITGSGVDMAADGGYDGVLFLTSLSVANAGNFMTAGHADADTGYAPTVATVNSGASDEDLILDIKQPVKRWVNVIVTTAGSSTTVESIWAVQYRGRTAPLTNALAGTLALAKFNAPATA
jgi:hypothetical protein